MPLFLCKTTKLFNSYVVVLEMGTLKFGEFDSELLQIIAKYDSNYVHSSVSCIKTQ